MAFYSVNNSESTESTSTRFHGIDDERETRKVFKPETEFSLDYREGISQSAATAQLLNVMMGVMLLLMPAAFRILGLLMAPLAILLGAAISTYALMAVSRVSNHFRVLDGVQGRPFQKVAERACQSTTFGTLVTVLLVLNLYGVIVSYITMIAGNVHETLLSLKGPDVSRRVLTAAEFPLLCLFCSRAHLRDITPMTVLGTVLISIGTAANLGAVLAKIDANGIADVVLFGDLSQLPIFFSIVVFAFGGTTVVVSIENVMEEPSRMHGFPSVIASTVIIVTLSCIVSGAVGYLAYGSATKAQLDHNLVKGSLISVTLLILVAAGSALSIPILFHVAHEEITNWIKPRTFWSKLLVRYAFLSSIMVLPLIKDDLVQVMELLSTLLALLQYVVPVIMLLPTFWPTWSSRSRILETLIGAVVVVYGIIAFFSGIYANVYYYYFR